MSCWDWFLTAVAVVLLAISPLPLWAKILGAFLIGIHIAYRTTKSKRDERR